MVVGFLACVECSLYARRGVYFGYDAFAQVTDAYVELDGGVGCL